MDEQSRDTCEFTGLQRSQNRVTQKPATYAPTLLSSIDRQPPDNHDGNGTRGIPPQLRDGRVPPHGAVQKTVEASDAVTGANDVGSGQPPLAAESVLPQPTVERLLATGEMRGFMFAGQTCRRAKCRSAYASQGAGVVRRRLSRASTLGG